MKRFKRPIRIFIILVVGIYAGLVLSSIQSSPSEPKTPIATVLAETAKPDVYDLWQDVNTQRTNAGLPALTLNENLNDSANAKCLDMAAKGYWSHDSPEGVEPWTFIERYAGKHNAKGENLYYGEEDDSANVVSLWMNSAGHKANIMDHDYASVGYAVCDAKNYQGNANVHIVVQHFVSSN